MVFFTCATYMSQIMVRMLTSIERAPLNALMNALCGFALAPGLATAFAVPFVAFGRGILSR